MVQVPQHPGQVPGVDVVQTVRRLALRSVDVKRHRLGAGSRRRCGRRGRRRRRRLRRGCGCGVIGCGGGFRHAGGGLGLRCRLVRRWGLRRLADRVVDGGTHVSAGAVAWAQPAAAVDEQARGHNCNTDEQPASGEAPHHCAAMAASKNACSAGFEVAVALGVQPHMADGATATIGSRSAGECWQEGLVLAPALDLGLLC
mmetsp:Transcript_99897/g.287047  ORF Transcript_99897/g.287047 Transcript_99897/m.287047 type:complete len:200 (+) Transcript_99897:1002-1601(+)